MTAAAERVWQAARAAAALRARLGRAGGCPPGLAEATAALQDRAGRLAPPGQAASQLDQLWELQSGLPAVIQARRNGPYLVTNVPRLLDHLGAESRPAPQLALCRCGSSAVKPLCDGACARTGFTDAKDPGRVPDRRDTYDGQQLTIIDNRGSCQHSGFCRSCASTRPTTTSTARTAPCTAPRR
jgi:CDGSH-type Zn-finger protein